MSTILLEIIDFLGFMFILIAAFLISSKYVANPKVRVVVFTSYFIACFFLIAWGWMASGDLFTWFTLQQTVLTFLNVRGIYLAVKELGGEKSEQYKKALERAMSEKSIPYIPLSEQNYDKETGIPFIDMTKKNCEKCDYYGDGS